MRGKRPIYFTIAPNPVDCMKFIYIECDIGDLYCYGPSNQVAIIIVLYYDSGKKFQRCLQPLDLTEAKKATIVLLTYYHDQ